MTGGPTFSIVVFAKDLEPMIRFYRALLQAEPTDGDGRYAVIEHQAGQLVLQAIPAVIAEEIEITDPPQRRQDTPIKIGFPVTSIEAFRLLAPGLGGVVDGPDREWAFGGNVVCDGHDPEGNVIQLHQPAP